MLVPSDSALVLRDFDEAGIEDCVRWETVETEWKLWHAPWEHEGQTDGQRVAALEEDVAWMHVRAREVMGFWGDTPRRRFETCVA